jgi:hypothetical protein
MIDENVINAIKGYSAIGGNMSYKFPFRKTESEILKKYLSQIKKQKKIIAWRGIGVSEKEWDNLFYKEKITEKNSIIKNNNKIESFTLDKIRAAGYGSGEIRVIFEAELNSYLKIKEYSIYPIEDEVLIYNKKFKVISSEYKNGMIWKIKIKEI